MPTRLRLLTDAFRKDFEEEASAYWMHDGNPRRPYVELRNGEISNGYFNAANVCRFPSIVERVSGALVEEFIYQSLMLGGEARMPDCVVGPAMGAITISHSVALQCSTKGKMVRSAFAEKVGDDFEFRRCAPEPNDYVLTTEDTITTLTSAKKVQKAVLQKNGLNLPFVLCFCNRSGFEEIEGIRIISAISATFTSWKVGENPFTPDGKELVPFVRNAKDNWNLLTQAYP